MFDKASLNKIPHYCYSYKNKNTTMTERDCELRDGFKRLD